MSKSSSSDVPDGVGAFIGVVVVLFIVVILGFSSIGTVDAGHVGVKTQNGAVIGEVAPGLYVKMPFIQSITTYDTRTQVFDTGNQTSLSLDQQLATTDIKVNYNPDAHWISWLYQNVATDYATTILEPAVLEALKATTAQYTATQLTANRAVVISQMQDALSKAVTKDHITITAISVTAFGFDPQYQQAIEQKQVAQQAVLTAQQTLDRVTIEAKQQVVQAQAAAQAKVVNANGEAQATLINAQAQSKAQQELALTLTPLYIQYKSLLTWDGRLPQYSSVPIPFLQVPSGK